MISAQPVRLLITGFGPFPGVSKNPSGDMLAWLRERPLLFANGVELRTEFIPTSWTAAETFVSETLARLDPDIVLHFGVHSRARGFRVETLTRNCANTRADVDGKWFGRATLAEGGPRELRATLEAEKLVQKLRGRGIPASVSADAGRYLCNMLLYLSLHQARETGRARQTGFIHIPPVSSPAHAAPGVMDKETLLDGAEIIAAHCIALHRRHSLARERLAG